MRGKWKRLPIRTSEGPSLEPESIARVAITDHFDTAEQTRAMLGDISPMKQVLSWQLRQKWT
jgi:hypothetical protein